MVVNEDNCSNLKGVDILSMDSIQIGLTASILLQTRNYVVYHNFRNTDLLVEDVVAYGMLSINKGIVSVALFFGLTARQRVNQYGLFFLKEQISTNCQYLGTFALPESVFGWRWLANYTR